MTMRNSALALAAVCLLASMYGASAGGAAQACVPDSGQIALSRGMSPMGGPWLVLARRHRNHSCDEALLEVNIRYQGDGQDPFIWGGGSALSPSGRLGKRFRLAGTDAPRASREEGELAGYVCGRADTIVARFSDGSRRTFSPRRPSQALRKRHVWLQNLGFFVIFHSPDTHVRTVTLIDSDGNAFARARNFGGELF
jgi:hypothetical protein